MDKIGVIVPVFNAEKTIERCIDSIMLNNGGGILTYEVVCVNDGSTDSTLSILEKLAFKYSNLLIISQENAGVSKARQVALDAIQCDYLAFCDADDWVEEDWLISMYTTLCEYKADFIKLGACVEYSNKVNNIVDTSRKNIESVVMYNQEQAIEAFIEHKMLNGILWTNLFKRSLFEGIAFDSQLSLFEDAEILFKIILRSNRIAVCNSLKKYHYVVDGDSLSNGKFNISKLESTIIFWNELLALVSSSYPNFRSKAQKKVSEVFLTSLFQMYKWNLSDSKKEQILVETIKSNGYASFHSLRDKVFALLIEINPQIARIFVKLYTKYR